MKEYYLKIGNRIKGSYLLDDLKYLNIHPDTLVRVDKEFSWRMQIDTDEANAAGIDEEHNVGEVIL